MSSVAHAAPAYDPKLLARAWARSAKLRRNPPPEPVRLPAEPAEPAYRVDDLEKARRDPAFFCSFVLRDEEGLPVKNAPHHVAFQAILSAERRAAILAFAEAAKSTAITIGRVLWELGHNPNLRVGILCEAKDRAAELVEVIGRYIRESAELHAVFPGLRPARKEADPVLKLKGRWVKWTMHHFTVERSARLRDPSVRAASVGKAVQGVRFDLLIADDLVTWETSYSARRRKKLSKWFKNAIAGRLTPMSRVWFLNTAYHPDDLIHEYAKKEAGYTLHTFPARVQPGDKVCTWAAKWTPEAFAQRIRDLGGEGSIEVARQIDCIPQNDTSLHFQETWVKKALDLGNGLGLVPSWAANDVPGGAFLVAGADPAVGATEQSAESAIVVLLCFPGGAPEWGYPPGYYQLAWIEAGRWDGPELLRRIHDVAHRFGCPVYVEDNATQKWLTQFPAPAVEPGEAPRRPAVILPFHTGANKWHPAFGVASIGVDMNAGRVAIPNDGGVLAEDVALLLRDLRTFSPEEHTGDRHMAFWIAREGGRRAAALTGGSVEVTIAGLDDEDEDDELGRRRSA